MVNLTNLKYPSFESKYFDIFVRNLVLGYNVGAATEISKIVVAPSLYQNAFLNRFVNIGIYNALQDCSFQRISADWKNETDNFLYLGGLQTVKFIPNLMIQNIMKNMFYKPGDTSTSTKFVNNFLVVSAGMTVFFVMGAIDSKISNETMKIQFVMLSNMPLFLTYLLTAPFDSQFIEKTKSTHLSLNGYMGTVFGLIASFIVPDVMHRLEIDKDGALEPNKVYMFDAAITGAVAIATEFDINLIGLSVIGNLAITNPLIERISLGEAKIWGYDLINVASLTIVAAASLVQVDPITAISSMVAFSVAKGVAVTSVEIVYDNKEYICSNFVLNPACEYLGIIEHSAEVVL